MFTDATKFCPPRPAFFDEGTSIRSRNGSKVNLLGKRRTGPLAKSRLSSIFSFHSKTSSQSGEVRVKSPGSAASPNGAPMSAPLSKLSAAFQARKISTTSQPVLDHDISSTRPGKGPERRHHNLDLFATKDYDSAAAKLKEDRQNRNTEDAERSRLSSFRFGGGSGVESSPNLLLPSPSEGLFEFPKRIAGSRSCPTTPLTIIPPPSSTSSTNSSTQVLHDPDLDHYFPIPSLLSPLMDYNPSQPLPPNIPLPPSPTSDGRTPIRRRANRLTLLPIGDPLLNWEDTLISPSLTHSRSPTDSSVDLVVSTPTLLESALCSSGCQLKISSLPKTWTSECVQRSSVVVERPVERGVWGLTKPSAEPSSAAIDFDEPIEMSIPALGDDGSPTTSEGSPLPTKSFSLGTGRRRPVRAYSLRLYPDTFSSTSASITRIGLASRRTRSLDIHERYEGGRR